MAKKKTTRSKRTVKKKTSKSGAGSKKRGARKKAGGRTSTKKRRTKTTGKKKTRVRRAPTRKKTRRTKRAGNITTIREEIKERMAVLERRSDELKDELADVDAELKEFRATFKPALRARRGGAASKKTGRKRRRNKTNLVDAVKTVLANKTMSANEIGAAVKKAGYRTSSSNFRSIISQTLVKNPDLFKRVARGQYTTK